MRVLGIDPGLRTTGFGVVERRAAPRYVASGTIRTGAAAPATCRPAEDHLRRRARGRGALCADLRVDGDRLRQRQSAVDAAARPGARRRIDGARRRRPRGLRIHRAADEEGDRRPRPGAQGAGPGDGRAPARRCRACRARTRPMRSAWRSAMPTRRRAGRAGRAPRSGRARTPTIARAGSTEALSFRAPGRDGSHGERPRPQAPRRQSAPHVCPL